jgi:trigger factor
MQVNVEKLSPVLMEFQIEVPADQVSTEVDNAYDSLRRTARVRGFRKGKAPRQVLVQLYGPAVRADVARKLVDASLQKALSEKAVVPLTKPAVEPAELKPKQSFSFKARFEVRPDIEQVNWEGLAARRKNTEVSEEQIGAEIEKLRQDLATEEPVEGRAAEKGDLASLKLAFEIDGEEHKEEVDKIEIGAGRILSFLDEAIVGMNAGDKKEVEGSFADNHPMEKLRGKKSSFQVEVTELKKRVLPEIDDEFAKDTEHDNLEALRTALREKVQKRLQQESEEEVAKQLVTDLCAKNPIPVPPSLVEQQARMTARELQMMAQMSGQKLEGDDLQRRLMMDSEMKVRAGLLMAEIARAKGVTVTEADIEKGYEELAEQTGKNVQKVKAEYRERSKREMLIGMILEDKVLNLMEGAAKIDGP